MFLGHYAAALAAKRFAPNAGLGALFAAAQWADLIWPFLLLSGIERMTIAPGETAFTPLRFDSYPVSHSLLALVGWGAVLGIAYALVRRSTVAGIVAGVLVVSHWVLDAVAHRPDMPLTLTGSARFGLGLWNSVGGTIAVEFLLFGIGIVMYARARPAGPIRKRMWGLLVVLLLIFVANAFGPPPPSERAVAYTVMAAWLVPLWAWWAERPRHHDRRA